MPMFVLFNNKVVVLSSDSVDLIFVRKKYTMIVGAWIGICKQTFARMDAAAILM